MQDMHAEVPANRLRELLEQRGLKLVDVAAKCRVSESTVWRWQAGGIPRQHVAKIAELLDVDVPYLDGWSDHEREPNGEPQRS